MRTTSQRVRRKTVAMAMARCL